MDMFWSFAAARNILRACMSMIFGAVMAGRPSQDKASWEVENSVASRPVYP